MGGKRATASGRKQQVQLRLDQMVKPRRSTRLRSNTNEKQDGNSKVLEKETTNDIQLLEIEEALTNTITLVSNEGSKKKRSQQREKKNKVVAEKVVQLTKELQIELLVKFDLNHMYGPCRGISRRERYLRAIKYRIEPAPDETIPKILDGNTEDCVFNKCIWDQNELLRVRH